MYRVDKTTQMAAQFLKKANGRLPYLVLLKLLYLADRQMLLQYGEPITFDKWVSMRNGPLLSATYDLIKNPEHSPVWSSHIKTDRHDIVLEGDPGCGALSELEDEVIDAVFAKYRDKSNEYGDEYIWSLVNLTHDLPEYDKKRALYGGVSKIPYAKVLALAGVGEEDIEDILDNINGYDLAPVFMAEAR